MSVRRVVSHPGFFTMVKSKPETWPVIGAVTVAVGYMGVRSFSALRDDSIRWDRADRSDPLHYEKQNPDFNRLTHLPDRVDE